MGIRAAHWDEWSLEGLLGPRGGWASGSASWSPRATRPRPSAAVVSRVREALMETVDLVDEIVVIDSDSVDDTYAVAESAGARGAPRLPRSGPTSAATPARARRCGSRCSSPRATCVVFMDADLHDWDTHFVPGLLGPLLSDPEVQLVKGFYDRPGVEGPLEGGRVTELVARPLIALLFRRPRRAGPAARGGVGGPAVVVRRLSVPTGYAVELRRARRHRPRRGPGRDRPGRPRGAGAPPPVVARPRRHGDPDHRRGAGPLRPGRAGDGLGRAGQGGGAAAVPARPGASSSTSYPLSNDRPRRPTCETRTPAPSVTTRP